MIFCSGTEMPLEVFWRTTAAETMHLLLCEKGYCHVDLVVELAMWMQIATN